MTGRIVIVQTNHGKGVVDSSRVMAVVPDVFDEGWSTVYLEHGQYVRTKGDPIALGESIFGKDD